MRAANNISTSSAPPGKSVQHVAQGEYAVSDDADTLLVTILGSCVATCLHDPVLRIGGMNHILLPGAKDSDGVMSHGVQLMELLINDLMRRGASRRRLQAKLFGGSRMIEGLSDAGHRNAAFAKSFLEDEGIPLVACSLGGTKARRVQFRPTDGKARQRILSQDMPPPPPPPQPEPKKPKPPVDAGDIELF